MLAIGLVVDDAIVVVEAVEHHIGEGMSPRDATLKAMEEVSGPVAAIALILSAVFLPTVFIPGITGRLYQQFAVTIAISVLLSAFNALTLSPALSALLLRPHQKSKGPLSAFFNVFNNGYGRLTDGYVGLCGALVRKSTFSLVFLGLVALGAGWFGKTLPTGFLPEEDQGFLYVNVQLPFAASMERTVAVSQQVEDMVLSTPGIESCTTVAGFSLLSFTRNTYSATFWVSLKDWGKRDKPEIVPFTPNYPCADAPWLKLVPESLYWLPRWVRDIYGVKAIYITENGAGYHDAEPAKGEVIDLDRRNLIATAAMIPTMCGDMPCCTCRNVGYRSCVPWLKKLNAVMSVTA